MSTMTQNTQAVEAAVEQLRKECYEKGYADARAARPLEVLSLTHLYELGQRFGDCASPHHMTFSAGGLRNLIEALAPDTRPLEVAAPVTDAEVRHAFPFVEGWNHRERDLFSYRRALERFAASRVPVAARNQGDSVHLAVAETKGVQS